MAAISLALQGELVTPAASPRQLAKQWRAEPAARSVIEILIDHEGMGGHFTRARNGDLIARLSDADWQRITASGGGSYMPAHERQFREDVNGETANAAWIFSKIEDAHAKRDALQAADDGDAAAVWDDHADTLKRALRGYVECVVGLSAAQIGSVL
jgi:hypothetical protein